MSFWNILLLMFAGSTVGFALGGTFVRWEVRRMRKLCLSRAESPRWIDYRGMMYERARVLGLILMEGETPEEKEWRRSEEWRLLKSDRQGTVALVGSWTSGGLSEPQTGEWRENEPIRDPKPN